ncbi:hypothetical protein GCM10010326_04620 [Streptomyces xanthochromogenes]|uniref:Uncharacterized protein n=1 Tax=Streptomyces xanthochromogenes TaxID=67384 RepID=A0ABQ2ZKN6_9ACTN|nr:hypothetical protein GCM10010326_04620 [Streptomyces xanthochromogenes]
MLMAYADWTADGSRSGDAAVVGGRVARVRASSAASGCMVASSSTGVAAAGLPATAVAAPAGGCEGNHRPEVLD